jgi:hypothetical protein
MVIDEMLRPLWIKQSRTPKQKIAKTEEAQTQKKKPNQEEHLKIISYNLLLKTHRTTFSLYQFILRKH